MREQLLILLALVVLGLVVACIRWGILGIYAFGAVKERLVAAIETALAHRRRLWSNPVLRLCVLSFLFLLTCWLASVVTRGADAFEGSDPAKFTHRPDWRYDGVEEKLAKIGYPSAPIQRFAKEELIWYMKRFHPEYEEVRKETYRKRVQEAYRKTREQQAVRRNQR